MVKVSIILPVYDEQPHIRDSIDSILDQSFGDFELCIISEDPSPDTQSIIQSFQDERIEHVKATGTGISEALNQGITETSGQYIARMDADDIAVPNRLATQCAFLDKNPDVGIVGSCCRLIDTDGDHCGSWTVPAEDFLIRYELLFSNPIPHPSAMMRRRVLDQHSLRYNSEFDGAEDYDLWIRLLKHTNGANIQAPLLNYRVETDHKKSIRDSDIQKSKADELSYQQLSTKFDKLTYSKNEIESIRTYLFETKDPVLSERELIEKYIKITEDYMNAYQSYYQRKQTRRKVVKRITLKLLSQSINVSSIPVLPKILRLSLQSL
jgi:glycosyltransferase involved in cell wall biosynthesis